MPKFTRREFIAAGALGFAGAAIPGRLTAEPGTKDIGKTPHSKFAINVEMWFTDLPFLERIKRVADMGFPAIEIWDYAEKDLAAIRETCDAHNLAVTQFTAWGFEPGMNDPKNHNMVVEKIEEACEVARVLGAKMATVVGGNDQPGMSQQEMHWHIIEALERVAPIAEKNDLMLILEPMNIRVDHIGHCLYGSEAGLRIVKAVDSSHVKLNWDLYHMQLSEGDLVGRMRDGFKWIGYLQLADTPGRNEPGTGEVHYNRVLKEAYDLGYRGYIGAECRPSGDPLEAAKRLAAADVF